MNDRFTNTNYDIRNQAFLFNDRTVNFAFLCKPIWGHANCITVPPYPDIIWGNGVHPRSALPLDYTTGDGRYFHIQKSPYLYNSHVTFFRI